MPVKISHFLKVPLWHNSQSALIKDALFDVSRGQSVTIVTLNAEMLLHASAHDISRHAIEAAERVVADTITVVWWKKYIGKDPVPRITGVDCATALLREAGEHKRSIALIGTNDEKVLSGARAYAKKLGVTSIFIDKGPHITEYSEKEFSQFPIKNFQAAKADTVFVAMGHGKQEWFIQELRKHVQRPAIYIGVGGTFAVWAGEVRRAPSFMRKLGLEWLWRFLHEPRRAPRIVRAVIVFPLRVLLEFLLY